MKVLADFGELRPAEEQLVKWLQAGNRKTCIISNSVPDSATEGVTLRATFIRYLALGGCDACRLPETGLRVAGAFIQGDEMRSGSTKGLDFEGAKLHGDLALIECRIPDCVLLRAATAHALIFNLSHLDNGIDADRLIAQNVVFMRGATCKGELRFNEANISGGFDCGKLRIEPSYSQLYIERDGRPAFSKPKKFTLGGARIHGSLYLQKAEIAVELTLIGAEIVGDIVCLGTKFTKLPSITMDNATIHRTFHLRQGCEIRGGVSLVNATFNAINDDLSCWPSELLLDGCRYSRFVGDLSPTDAKSRLAWLTLQPKQNGGFFPDPYEQCAKVLREMGHGAEATKILIEKERLQRQARRERIARDLTQARRDRDEAPKQDGLRLHTDRVIGHWLHLTGLRVWDAILGAVVGYGRKPQNAGVWALAMLIIGTLVFANAAGHGAIKPNLPQIQLNPAWVSCATDPRGQLDCFLNHPDAASYPRFNAFIYSADTLIPVVSLEMQSYWIPDDRSDRGMLARGYLWFHIAMGWALTLLAVAGFSGLIKTDNTK